MGKPNGKQTVQVKYRNELSQLCINSMSSSELNAFFAILSAYKNVKDNNPVREFTFKEFRELAQLPRDFIRNDQLQKFFEGMLPKILSGSISIETARFTSSFTLFDRIQVDRMNKTITIILSNSCMMYFQDYLKGYTCFPLVDFCNLKKKYAKLLYRTLARYKSVGKYECDYDEFINDVLGVPTTLKRFKVFNTVIKPAYEELIEKTAFQDLEVYYKKDPINPRRYKKIGFTFKAIIEPQNSVENLPGSSADQKFIKIVKMANDTIDNSVDNISSSFANYRLYILSKDKTQWSDPEELESKEGAKRILIDDDIYKITFVSKTDNGEEQEEIIETNVSKEELEEIEYRTGLPF